MSSSYRSSRLGLSHCDPHTTHRGGCLELYYCNMVEWCPGGIQASSARPTGFLQCFDTVGLVIWPVKIVPDMTYNVFGETLNLAQSINQSIGWLLMFHSSHTSTRCWRHNLTQLLPTASMLTSSPGCVQADWAASEWGHCPCRQCMCDWQLSQAWLRPHAGLPVLALWFPGHDRTAPGLRAPISTYKP